MKIGTKSVLYGAHCFWIHPWFVALGWWKLYGFPLSPLLWLCFFVHDLGYWGKPNMDGPEGEEHPRWAANLMYGLTLDMRWWSMCMYHSRYFAKQHMTTPSQLCFADKMAFVITPSWIYVPCVWMTGEWKEYAQAHNHEVKHNSITLLGWYKASRAYVKDWVYKFKDGGEDTWTQPKGLKQAPPIAQNSGLAVQNYPCSLPKSQSKDKSVWGGDLD